MTDADVVVEARGVGFAWGAVAALHDVSFRLRRGTITGFLGRNGAGKSTTMRLLAGLGRPDTGVVVVDGKAAHLAAARAVVGYCPEEAPVAAGLTVREQLRFAASLRQLPRAAEEVRRVVELLDLSSVESRLCGALSKGTRQRVGVAMALLGEPTVLLLDEPTAGLDPSQVSSLRALLLRARDGGAAILLSSHVTAEIEALADDVVALANGRVVHRGPRASLPSAVAAIACGAGGAP
jgi:ABC-2 type transport system ATP-binding protein